MTALRKEAFSERMPTEIETKNAGELLQIMSGIVNKDEPTQVDLALDNGETANVVLMPAIAKTFVDVLRLISSGRGFQLIPVDAELTTQQAADHLNVSRPYLIKLLEQHEIPFTKTGRHRRIRAEDLFAYKARRDNTRSEALAEMARYDAERNRL